MVWLLVLTVVLLVDVLVGVVEDDVAVVAVYSNSCLIKPFLSYWANQSNQSILLTRKGEREHYAHRQSAQG